MSFIPGPRISDEDPALETIEKQVIKKSHEYKEFTLQEKDIVNTDRTTTTLTDFSELNVGDRVDPVAEKQDGAKSKLVPLGITGTTTAQTKEKNTQSVEAFPYPLRTVSDENAEEKIQKKMQACSEPSVGTDVKKLPISPQTMQKRMHANSEPPVTIEDVKPITPTGTGVEKLLISPQTMLENHILRGDAIVRTSPCAAIMLGIKQCGKTTATEKILGCSRNAYGAMAITPLLDQSREGSKECLSHYKLIVVGEEPYEDDLSWIIAPHNVDVAALFLLSYFVKVCKIRDDYNYEKLEFTQGPASTFFPDSTLNDQVNALHERVARLWEEFKKNKEGTSEKGILNVLPAGVSLINIFDVGPSKAAQDFVPFLNKYCKRSMLLTCYSDTKDARHLKEELTENTTCTGMKSNQLLRQLKGCLNEEQIVIIMKLINESIPLPHDYTEEDQVKEAIKANVDAQNVKHLVISDDKLAEAAATMERTIVKGPFHLAVYLREILLLQTIRMNTNSFWVKKDYVEELSDQLKFMNGSVDRFLKIFTTFGSIFYTHDIPALDEYVIVNITGFVEHLDQLYCSSEHNKLFRYGLFQYDDNKDKEVIFKFLTVLGIAVKVSSTQLALPQAELIHYCYIPMARQTPSSHDNLPPGSPMQDDSIVISFDRCIAENLQACLCHEVLSKGGRLIPTDNPDMTVVQVKESETPIEITDFGKDVRITVKQNGTSAKRILSRMLIAFPCLKTKSGAILHYQVTKVSKSFTNKDTFIEFLQTTKCKSHCIQSSNIELAMMVNIAEQLSDMHSDNMDKLYSAFKMTQEQQQTSCRPEITILQMMLDFFNRSTNKEFNDTLKYLGISPKKLE